MKKRRHLVLRRAQAALEFLLNYGWVLIAVIVALGAMSYFGVLNPSNLLGEKCNFGAEFGCPDFVVGDDGVSVILKNNVGKDMLVSRIAFSSDALSGSCVSSSLNGVLRVGKQSLFYANDPGCSFVDTGRDKNKYNITVTYSKLDSGLSHAVSGLLFARHGDVSSVASVGGFGGGSSRVGYWKFDEFDSLNAMDYSGNGNDGTFVGETWNDGTLTNGPSLTAGRYGNALSIVNSLATQRYVGIPDNPALNWGASDFTITGWVKLNQPTEKGCGIFGNYPHAGQNGDIVIGISDDVTQIFLFHTNTGGAVQFYYTTFTPYFDSWHHIAWKKAGDQIYFYVDGDQKQSWTSLVPFDVNFQPDGATGYYIGNGGWCPAILRDTLTWQFDEHRIYSRALTLQEISDDMDSAYPVDRAVGSWSFEKIVSNQVQDTHNIVKGRSGAAMSLDGLKNTYLSVNTVKLSLTNSNFTIAAWVKPQHTPDNFHSIYGATGCGVDNDVILGVSGTAQVSLAFCSDDLNVGYAMKNDTWQHIVATYRTDTRLRSIYVDGDLIGSGTANANPVTGSTDWRIGYNGADGAKSFNGTIDEVAIYNRALTAAEVAALAS